MGSKTDDTFENWLKGMPEKKRAFYASNPNNRDDFSTKQHWKPKKPIRYRGLWQQKFGIAKRGRTFSESEKERFAAKRGYAVFGK